MKRAFYPEMMVKRRPKPPRKILGKGIARKVFQVISPSKMSHYIFMGDREVIEYRAKTIMYLCWLRKLSKEQWKDMYRAYRKAKNELGR